MARELFPDVLHYVAGTPATYGFATRNGRTLADNAPEVMMSLVAGTAIPLAAQAVGRQEPTSRQVPVRRASLGHRDVGLSRRPISGEAAPREAQ